MDVASAQQLVESQQALQYQTSVLKLQLDGARAQGNADAQLIESAARVARGANPAGVGERVDVTG